MPSFAEEIAFLRQHDESASNSHRTIHFVGDKGTLNKICQRVFGVSTDEVTDAF